jgi:hypothetical protein
MIKIKNFMHSRIMVVRKAHALSVAVRIGTVRLLLLSFTKQHKQMWCSNRQAQKN